MMYDPQQMEAEITDRLRSDPDLINRIEKTLITEFVKAKQALQISVLARDPLGLAGPQTLTPDQEACADRYETALNNLDAVTKEQS
jgi:hypothetical protein